MCLFFRGGWRSLCRSCQYSSWLLCRRSVRSWLITLPTASASGRECCFSVQNPAHSHHFLIITSVGANVITNLTMSHITSRIVSGDHFNLQILQNITFSLLYVHLFQTSVAFGPHVTRPATSHSSRGVSHFFRLSVVILTLT